MPVSLAEARELQRIVRIDPSRAPAIVGDLVAELNRLNLARGRNPAPSFQALPLYNPPVETPEQREQRLLIDLEEVSKLKEEAAAKAKVEAVRKARIDAIDCASELSRATTDVLNAIRGIVNYNSGDVVCRDTWWKFRKELQPLVSAHGFKLVNVGTKDKPRAALAEV